MRIVSRSTLVLFYKKHADAETAIEEWIKKTEKADWSCAADVKRTFNSVDSVGNQHYVFNIKGNDYRLVAVIKFQIKINNYLMRLKFRNLYEVPRNDVLSSLESSNRSIVV